MKERKNIDRLYQEQFKDFEATPKEAIWKNIAAKLEDKKAKKQLVFPLWYKLTGVAASLAIIFAISYTLMDDFNLSTTPTVVFEYDDNNLPKIKIENNPRFKTASKQLEQLIQSNYTFRNQTDKSTSNSPNVLIAEEEENYIQQSAGQTNSSEKNSSPAIAKAEFEREKNNNEQNEIHEFLIFKKPLLDQVTENSTFVSKTTPGDENEKVKEKEKTANAFSEVENEKNKESDDLIAENTQNKKIRITTFAAPVFYDNMGSGNSIHSQFANNASSAEVTMSYGINIAYAISDKLKIRSGVNKVSMSYNIEDIAYSAAFSSNNITSINYNNNAPYEVRTASAPIEAPPSGSRPLSVESNLLSGEINQRFGFIEIPVEVEYNLVNKKFGINIIGGGSGLLLDENMISLNSENQNTQLGEANNLNQISFSTNVGLGVDYNLSDSFQLNLEPILKYQINTFKNTHDVQPYYFGIYSGFSFKF